MGLFKLSCGDTVVPGNPVPYRFTILETYETGRGVAARIRYPDATNFEGTKVCVYLDLSEKQLRAATVLDPHFRADDLSPFARFEPTDAGWREARRLLDT